jgi:hypothetical protein
MMQRVLSTMQFLWVLGQATVDGLTRWLRAFTKHHRTMSDVLCAERYLLTQELLRVSTPRAKPLLYFIKATSPLLPAEPMWSRASPIPGAEGFSILPAGWRGTPRCAGPALCG